MKNLILALLCSFGLLACSSSKEATTDMADGAQEEMAEKAEGMKHDAEEAKEDAEHHAEEMKEDAEHDMNEMKEKAEMGPATPLPAMAGSLAPMTADYGVMISIDQGDFPMDMTASIKEEGDLWSVSNTMVTPQGDVSDVCLITKDTFESKKRSMAQGPVGINISYEGGKATGMIEGGPTPVDIDSELAGPVLCGGAAMPFVVSRLPLAADYTTLLPIFDPSAQVGKNMSATVTGEETLELESGTFETYKVDLKMADGSAGGDISMWISKGDNPMMVKMMQAIPQMNGLMISELKAVK